MYGENKFFIELKSTVLSAIFFYALDVDLNILSLVITNLQSAVWLMVENFTFGYRLHHVLLT